jgi:hypothetical protein
MWVSWILPVNDEAVRSKLNDVFGQEIKELELDLRPINRFDLPESEKAIIQLRHDRVVANRARLFIVVHVSATLRALLHD